MCECDPNNIENVIGYTSIIMVSPDQNGALETSDI